MEIEYQVEEPNKVCKTECPFGKMPRVGSAACSSCECFIDYHPNENIIGCEFPEKVLKHIAETHPQLYMKYVTEEMLIKFT